MRQLTVMSVLFVVFVAPAFADGTTGTGFIANRTERILQAELPGTLVEILVKDRQYVEQGEVLATIRSHDLELRTRRAIAPGRARTHRSSNRGKLP